MQHSQRFLDDEVADGYRPCDPSIIVERVQETNSIQYIVDIFAMLNYLSIFYLLIIHIGHIFLNVYFI